MNLTRRMWRLNSTPMPTARIRMTAGTALSLMPRRRRAPNSWPTMLAVMKLRRRKMVMRIVGFGYNTAPIMER